MALALLASTHLHAAVREAGGAYDVGAFADTADEVLLHAGEDPSPLATLRAFLAGARWAARGRFSPQDLYEAKLTVIGELDAPLGPAGYGLSAFSYGVTRASAQEHRSAVLRTETRHVRAAARRYLVKPLAAGAAGVVVAGNAPALLADAVRAEKKRRSTARAARQQPWRVAHVFE